MLSIHRHIAAILKICSQSVHEWRAKIKQKSQKQERLRHLKMAFQMGLRDGFQQSILLVFAKKPLRWLKNRITNTLKGAKKRGEWLLFPLGMTMSSRLWKARKIQHTRTHNLCVVKKIKEGNGENQIILVCINCQKLQIILQWPLIIYQPIRSSVWA